MVHFVLFEYFSLDAVKSISTRGANNNIDIESSVFLNSISISLSTRANCIPYR